MRQTALKKRALALFVWLGCSSFAAYAQGGSISGTVVDQQGHAVSGASVNAGRQGVPVSSIVRFVETDIEGHFVIDHLRWGKYNVFAMKESAGYPNMAFSFYSNDSATQASITPAVPAAKIRIRLGPKSGLLSGSVTDSQTGGPVNANFKLSRAASPGKWLSSSEPSTYRVLLPPRVGVLIQVSAPGYETWKASGPLRLQPDERMELNIHLEPSRNPDLPTSEFLIPDGYVGWVLLDCNVKNTPPTPPVNGVRDFKFPKRAVLLTSSDIPAEAAPKRYLYYTQTGSTKDTLTDYRRGHGMVWGAAYGTAHGVLSEFHFFVGDEQQYKKQGFRGLESPAAFRP